MNVGARRGLILILGFCCVRTGAAVVQLCSAGADALPVVISPAAGERVRGSATSLAVMLSRISGAAFRVQEGDGRTGIAVGTVHDFPALAPRHRFAGHDLAAREHYVLSSHRHGLHVIGATATAVSDAVWDLLYRLGYRQFFPGAVWEVVPRSPSLSLDIDVNERPDYVSRRIWYAYGLWDYNPDAYREWCVRNRAVQGFVLNTGHAYERIMRRNRDAFEAHPEYRGWFDGSRTSSKLCIGNPDLRRLVCDHAVNTFREDPDLDSISVDPSDGGNWCTCARCTHLGSISDRAVTLANAVALAVTRDFPDKYVGMYAYNEHSPPPSIEVHPHVVISIATGFIRGGYSVDELFSSWGAKGNPLGVREYYSVFAWSRDLPGRSRGGNRAYLAETIPAFHRHGARFFSAESGDNWGCNGLGYYVAARLLWDVTDADRMDSLVDDFLQRAFGTAQAPMRRFYDLIDGGNHLPVSDDLVGRMYRCLDEALSLCDAEAIRARLRDLVLYTHYVERYRTYARARGAERQQAFEALVRYAYRIRSSMMVHSKALYRDLVRRDSEVSIPEPARWNVPEGENPWKDSTPFTPDEITRLVRDGIVANPTVAFTPIRFSARLIPARELVTAPSGEWAGATDLRIRRTNRFYVWVDDAPTTLAFEVTGGLIEHYRNRGNVKLDLRPLDQDRDGPVAHAEAPPDGQTRSLVLETSHRGLHELTVADGGDMTRLRWDPAIPVSLPASLTEHIEWQGRASFVFYVPTGTGVVGLFVEGSMDILDGDGTLMRAFEDEIGNTVAIPVPAGQDGRFWTVANAAGRCALLTVPPYLALAPESLLLPVEVNRKAVIR